MTRRAAVRRAGLDVAATTLREVGAVLRSGLSVVTPHRPLPAPTAPTLPPALLVHGYLGHPAMLRPLGRRLLEAGAAEVVFVHYPSLTARLEEVVDAIAREAAPLARQHGAVDVVGHSLGAFATRVWLKCFGGHEVVRRFVSIGGPHAGTSLHRIVPSPVGRAMHPDGNWVRRVADGPEPVPTTVVRARFDHQVFPPVRARIPGVQEVVLGGHGHNGLLFAHDAHDAVVDALSRPDPT